MSSCDWIELWLQAAQKDSEARRAKQSTSGGVLAAVRWSEAIERNEAYESFSAVCEVSDGTHDQYHRFVLSVLDALRGNRDCGSLLGRRLFIRAGLDPYVGPPALVYSSLGILVTLVLWVAFFRG